MKSLAHHESWVEAKSVKERFPIKPRNVSSFLSGEFIPSESMNKWMKPDSKGVQLIKNEKELEQAMVLSRECQYSVLEMKFQPMVRTAYRRTAFQVIDYYI